MLFRLGAFLSRHIPFLKRALRRLLYEYLSSREQADHWTCMNYGYAGPDTESATMKLDPQLEPERYCLQLYHHVVNGVDIVGKDVLEVGSGRGGGAAFLHGLHVPRSYTGLDYSTNAIRFCQQRFEKDGLRFLHGDAEDIPFPADSFDVVVNIESSHCYRSMKDFLAGVVRVLRPGGHLLFADFRHGRDVQSLEQQFHQSGLNVIELRDITPAILSGLELDRDRKEQLIRELAPAWLVDSVKVFAGNEKSNAVKGFISGRSRYLSATLQRPPVE